MATREIKILMIEDSLDQARLMQTVLGRTADHFQIEHVTSAEKGLECLQRSFYDIVLLDYNLPGMDGLQAIVAIKNQSLRIPIVMVTGQGNERIAVKAMKLGANDYIVKDAEFLKTLPRVIQRVAEDSWLQRQLAASERRYRELFEKASDGIVIVNPSDLRMLEVNSRMENLLLQPRSELVNKTLLDICQPRLQNKLTAAIHQILVEGSLNFDYIQLGPAEGKFIPVDINASLIDDAGRPTIQMFIRDITERKRMQQQIEIDRRRLISLFDGITDPISVIDHKCQVIMVNRKFAELAGSPARDLIGKSCHQVLYYYGESCEDCQIRITFTDGKSHFRELIQNRQTYHIWTFPMFGLDGKPEFVVEYAKDVTEQKNIEQQLIKSEKLATIGLLSSGIAHELRNPLNIIETARYAIEQVLPPMPSDSVKNLEIIKKNIRRASRIIENLLQFSRHSDKEKEQIDVASVLDLTLSFFEKEIALRRIELIRDYQYQEKIFFGLDSLKQVLLNIILNAIQAMPNGGKLSIGARATADIKWLDLSVTDTGIGIRTEDLTHIFSPFFSTKKAGEGTGLGLYVSYSIIKREGGDILVESTPGQKTCFTVRLPINSK